MFGLASELKLNLDEHETVKEIVQHFDREIRRADTGHKIQTINEFLETLVEFDSDDASKRNKLTLENICNTTNNTRNSNTSSSLYRQYRRTT